MSAVAKQLREDVVRLVTRGLRDGGYPLLPKIFASRRSTISDEEMNRGMIMIVATDNETSRSTTSVAMGVQEFRHEIELTLATWMSAPTWPLLDDQMDSLDESLRQILVTSDLLARYEGFGQIESRKIIPEPAGDTQGCLLLTLTIQTTVTYTADDGVPLTGVRIAGEAGDGASWQGFAAPRRSE